jgi:release factor glutamine methyltransferase
VEVALQAGRVRFLGIDLLVGPGALVPRQETELLGRTAIDVLQRERDVRDAEGSDALRVVDMCCGAGNLACAIASNIPGAQVWATDLTDACVAVARRNVDHLGLGDRVSVLQGDLFAPLAELGLQDSIDLVVCNPPYISSGRLAKDRAELLVSEPREAFDGGPYGLTLHQRVIQAAPHFLRPRGWLIFEFGLGQDRQLAVLFARSKRFEEVDMKMDAESRPRVVAARKRGA